MAEPDIANTTGAGYAVVLTRKTDGHRFLAWGPNATPAVFDRRQKAVEFRDALWKEHGCSKGKVVRVTWTIGT
jgi:hypothetical protein